MGPIIIEFQPNTLAQKALFKVRLCNSLLCFCSERSHRSCCASSCQCKTWFFSSRGSVIFAFLCFFFLLNMFYVQWSKFSELLKIYSIYIYWKLFPSVNGFAPSWIIIIKKGLHSFQLSTRWAPQFFCHSWLIIPADFFGLNKCLIPIFCRFFVVCFFQTFLKAIVHLEEKVTTCCDLLPNVRCVQIRLVRVPKLTNPVSLFQCINTRNLE